MQPTEALHDLAVWLADTARRVRTITEFHRLFCDHLHERGLPIWRSSLGLEMLHPEVGGAQIRWVARETETLIVVRGDERIGEYENSPAQIADDTNEPYRRRLDEGVSNLPLLHDLREMGATDYLIVPLPFLDRSRTAHISFATQKDGGFSAQELAALTQAADLFSPYAERDVLKRIAMDLLATYVGRRSAAKVYDGAIDRANPDNIMAAILIADLRGFTRFSDETPIAEVLATLNGFFDALVGAIEAQGGEVLKFIGDAVLAIFPANPETGIPYAAALAAARDGRARVAGLNAARAAARQSALRFGLALHAGEIAYGNIGSRSRLDFTVIGPAINHTSRLVELAKRLDRTVLISEAFAQASGAELARLGSHRLRDVAEMQQIYALPADA